MTDMATLVDKTRNLLFGLDAFEYPRRDRIGANMNDSTEDITVDTFSMWKADAWAEFDDGEIVRFITDAASNGTATVSRGERDTTAASHSDGDDILKNPAFGRVFVEEIITEVVNTDLWDHVWTWHTDSLTPSDTDFMYDLDDWVEEVVLVYQENLGADERFRPLPPGWWDVERRIESTVATNENLLVLHRVFDYDEPVYYTAKRRPDPSAAGLTALSDPVANMVPWAAAAKCLAAKSVQLKNASVRTRKDDGDYMRDYRALMAEFIRMRDDHRRLLLKEVRPDQRFRKAQRAYGRTF